MQTIDYASVMEQYLLNLKARTLLLKWFVSNSGVIGSSAQNQKKFGGSYKQSQVKFLKISCPPVEHFAHQLARSVILILFSFFRGKSAGALVRVFVLYSKSTPHPSTKSTWRTCKSKCAARMVLFIRFVAFKVYNLRRLASLNIGQLRFSNWTVTLFATIHTYLSRISIKLLSVERGSFSDAMTII